MNSPRPKSTTLWPLLCVGGLLFFCLTLVFALQPAPLDLAQRFLPPTRSHWLGTDHYGRDTLRLVLGGGFWSLSAATLSVGLGALVGITLGLLATYKRTLSRVVLSGGDMLFALPAVLTALVLSALYRPGLVPVVCAIALFNIPLFLRLSHSRAQTLYASDFVRAARSLGASEIHIVRNHILPSLMPLMGTQIATQMALALLAESSLSYLGLSVPAPNASWGAIIREGQNFLSFTPIPVLATALALFLCVLAFTSLARACGQSRAQDSLLQTPRAYALLRKDSISP